MTAAAAATVLSSCMLMFARKGVATTHKRIVAGNSALNNYIASVSLCTSLLYTGMHAVVWRLETTHLLTRMGFFA